MNHYRYFVRKSRNAKPEKDEEDYEEVSDFFVTLQTTPPPDGFEPGELVYVRYIVRT
jgi:hypothetical protein